MAESSPRSLTSRAPTRYGSIPATSATSWRARTRAVAFKHSALSTPGPGSRIPPRPFKQVLQSTTRLQTCTRLRIRLLPTPSRARRSGQFRRILPKVVVHKGILPSASAALLAETTPRDVSSWLKASFHLTTKLIFSLEGLVLLSGKGKNCVAPQGAPVVEVNGARRCS